MAELNKIIFIHGGGAGCNVGEEFWKLACKKHNINFDGTRTLYPKTSNCNPETIFRDNCNGLFRPEALFIDPDDQSLTKIKNGELRKLWNIKSNFTSHNEDTGGIYSVGYYLLYHDLCINNKLRVLAETMDNIDGLVLTRSISGGTGSGIMARLIERDLPELFQKKPIIDISICPSPHFSNNTVEPYNAVFAMGSRNTDLTLLFDNEALAKFANTKKEFNKFISYSQMNYIIARVIGILTAKACFNSESVLSKIQLIKANPKFNFAMPSLSYIDNVNSPADHSESALKLTKEVLSPKMQLLSYPLEASIGNYFIYQGFRQLPFQKTIELVKSTLSEATIISTNISYQNVEAEPPNAKYIKALQSFELAHLSANKAIKHTLTDITKKYDKLYSVRAFLHWIVGIGLSEECFGCERENVKLKIQEIENA